MALYDECKLLVIIIREMGVIKLPVGGCLVNMNFMMSLYGIIIIVAQYSSELIIECLCFVYHCPLTCFLSVIVVTLTQSQINCQHPMCSFLQTPSGVDGLSYCLFTGSIPKFQSFLVTQILTQACVGFLLIQVLSWHSVKGMCVCLHCCCCQK